MSLYGNESVTVKPLAGMKAGQHLSGLGGIKTLNIDVSWTDTFDGMF